MFTDNLSGYLRPQQIQHVNIHRPKTDPLWVKNTVDFKNEALAKQVVRTPNVYPKLKLTA